MRKSSQRKSFPGRIWWEKADSLRMKDRKRALKLELLDIFAQGKPYKEQVYQLYEEAFPAEEKKPLTLLEQQAAEGKMELLAVTQDGEFIGLAMNMLAEKTALLDYFAIAEEKRSGGYGGRAVRLLQERFAGRPYIFEVEMLDESAPNAEQRKRRMNFYLRNGLKETGVFVRVYETDFHLLTPDGQITYELYLETLREIMGEEGMAFLNPSLIKTEK